MSLSTNGTSTTTTKAAPPKASRMTLAAVTRGKQNQAPRIILYGTDGVGKTHFGSKTPKPIFLCSEKGTAQFDVARFPEATSWHEALEAVRVLETEPHDYQTLVVDTLDWLEQLCQEYVCKKGGWSTISEPGYGKGPDAVLMEWSTFLAALDRLHSRKNMNVVLLAHCQIRQAHNPEGEDYERYELSMLPKVAGKTRQWVDATLFARYETYAAKKDGKFKGVDTGARIMHTVRKAAWDAKNRYDLPETMPLDWDLLAEAIEAHKPADPAYLTEQINAMLTKAPPEVAKKVKQAMTDAANDTAELARIADKLSGIINTSTTNQENGK